MKTTKRDRILEAASAAKEDLRLEREATKALRGQVAYLTDQIEVERRNALRGITELRAQVAARDITIAQQQKDLDSLCAPRPATGPAPVTSTCGLGTAVAPTFPEKPMTAPTPEEVPAC